MMNFKLMFESLKVAVIVTIVLATFIGGLFGTGFGLMALGIPGLIALGLSACIAAGVMFGVMYYLEKSGKGNK